MLWEVQDVRQRNSVGLQQRATRRLRALLSVTTHLGQVFVCMLLSR